MSTGNCSDNSKKPNKSVEDKLAELELGIDSQAHHDLPAPVSSQDLMKTASSEPLKNDLYYFGGIALMLLSVLIFFQHVHLGTGIMQAFGMGGGGLGLLLIPLLAGIGLIIYNKENKIGYAVVSVTCALVLFAVLSSLVMTFPSVSLLGIIIMLAPLTIGAAFFVKGMGGPKGIEYSLRKQGLINSEIQSIEKHKQL